jgi:hypothetical protein
MKTTNKREKTTTMATTTAVRTTATSHCSWVGMGVTRKRRDNSNSATRPNGTTTQRWDDRMTERQNDRMTGDEGETTRRRQRKREKKAQETLFDVSWAVGKSFSYSCSIIVLLTIFFMY